MYHSYDIPAHLAGDFGQFFNFSKTGFLGGIVHDLVDLYIGAV
jgi:hypothetical protein